MSGFDRIKGGIKRGEMFVLVGKSEVGRTKFAPNDPNARVIAIDDLTETFCPLCELGIPLKDVVVKRKPK